MTTTTTSTTAVSTTTSTTAKTTATTGRAGAVGSALLSMALCGSSVGVTGLLPARSALLAQGLRYAVAVAVLLVVAASASRPLARLRTRDLPRTVTVAVVGIVGFAVALTVASRHADPAVTGVAIAAVPLALAVSGPLAGRRRPAGRLLAAGLVVLAGGFVVEGAGRADALGTAAALSALACEVTFTLAAVPLVRRYGALSVTVHCCVVASVVLVVTGAALGEHVPVDAATWLSIAYLGVVVTAVAFVLWYRAVAVLGAETAGQLAGVVPIAAVTTAVLTHGDLPTLPVAVGISVVVAGLVGGLVGGHVAGQVSGHVGGARAVTTTPPGPTT